MRGQAMWTAMVWGSSGGIRTVLVKHLVDSDREVFSVAPDSLLLG
jgi:hypothetical protein